MYILFVYVVTHIARFLDNGKLKAIFGNKIAYNNNIDDVIVN